MERATTQGPVHCSSVALSFPYMSLVVHILQQVREPPIQLQRLDDQTFAQAYPATYIANTYVTNNTVNNNVTLVRPRCASVLDFFSVLTRSLLQAQVTLGEITHAKYQQIDTFAKSNGTAIQSAIDNLAQGDGHYSEEEV